MKNKFTIVGLLLISSIVLSAQKQITLVPFSSGYTDPQGITNCGDSRLFIIQRNGLIFVCDSAGVKKNTPFLDLKSKVKSGGEKGLLGLTFDPDYFTNGYFYVHYTNKSGHAQISRFKVSNSNPNIADSSSEKKIFENIDHLARNHNGGDIHFGPDGYLYISFGDGGEDAGHLAAQNPMKFLGKMIRIDVHHGNPYSIPADNPFVDSANYLPEIWALGFRNPWRWSFDAVTGDLRIADVGEATWEEVDFQAAGDKGGENYGWACYEGKHEFETAGCKAKSKYTFPIYNYQHVDTAGGACAIIGGYVYRGSNYPYLYGKYLFGDYCNGIITALYDQSGNLKKKELANTDDFAITAFGENYKHEQYVTNYVNGSIYRLTVTSEPVSDLLVEKHAENNFLTITPNPSDGNFVITCTSGKSQRVNIRIQNFMAQQFYTISKSVNAGVNTFPMIMRLPKGDYFVSLTDAAGKTANRRLKIE
jgi:glucose/arabinose dehydrogenase